LLMVSEVALASMRCVASDRPTSQALWVPK
jgi:hypothetical protein